MHRNFSANSKQNILRLISEVEADKSSNFTVYVRDHWSDFDKWISKLGIKSPINDVNSYHKKVISKNNDAKTKTDKIFSSVSSIDRSYCTKFSTIRNSLKQSMDFIKLMSSTISPNKGRYNAQYEGRNTGNAIDARTKSINNGSNGWFTIEHVRGILEPASKLLTPIVIEDDFDIDYSIIYTLPIYNDAVNSNEHKYSIQGERFWPALLKLFSKMTKDNDNKAGFKLSASSLSYLTGLCTFLNADYDSPEEMATGGLKLTKSTMSAWGGLYKYYDSTLKPLEASRLSKRFGKINNCVSIVGSLCGFSADSISMFRTLFDENADVYEKADRVLNEVSSGFDLGNSVINVKLGQKHLVRSVTAKYEWRTSYASESILKKAGTVVSLADVSVDTVRGFTSRYGQVTADGNFSSRDIGEVGIYGSVRGLTSIVSKATFGLSDAVGLSDKADDISAGIVNFADTTGADYVRKHEFSSAYVRGAQGMMDYANDESNNIVGRVAVSAVAGAGMITAVAIDGIGDACSAIGKGISEGWKHIFG